MKTTKELELKIHMLENKIELLEEDIECVHMYFKEQKPHVT